MLGQRQNEFQRARKRFNPADEETLHEMRIALKKFRYALEAAQPLLRGSMQQRAEQMHAYQQLMGDIRDIEILKAELEKWAAKKGKKIAVVGILDHLEQKRGRLLKRIARSNIDKILASGHSKPVKETIHATADAVKKTELAGAL